MAFGEVWDLKEGGGDEEAGGQRHGGLGGETVLRSMPAVLTCLLRKLRFISLPSG